MFLWNVHKCVQLFDAVYVSSDSDDIISLAEKAGARGIKRGEDLCGETPDIDVYKHAYAHFKDKENVLGIVAVHANNPTIHPILIARAKFLVEVGTPEVMTCYPMSNAKKYHNKSNKINGSIRGMSVERLMNYGDPYAPNPEILMVDDSIEIETPRSYNAAKRQWSRHP